MPTDSDPKNFASQLYVGRTGDSEALFLVVAGHLTKKREWALRLEEPRLRKAIMLNGVASTIHVSKPRRSDHLKLGGTGVNSIHGYPSLNQRPCITTTRKSTVESSMVHEIPNRIAFQGIQSYYVTRPNLHHYIK